MATFNGTVDKLEDNRNKVDDISSVTSEAESVKYPSVKALKDHITGLSIPSIENGTCPLILTQNNTGITSTCTATYYTIGNIIALSAEFEFTAITGTTNAITITGFPRIMKGVHVLAHRQWDGAGGGPECYGVMQSDGSMLVLFDTLNDNVKNDITNGYITSLSFNIVARIN